jgi:MFS family permease
MTTLLVLVAVLVALAAAVRSTWSPCGLSMLSTITPLSERGKGHSFRATASWFVAGALVGGVTLGALAAVCAAGVRALGPSPLEVGLVAVVAASVTALSDLAVGGFSLPIHRRQVNERWLDHYRPWVYGAGFGWQIGVGLATYITTAAVYLTVVLAALTANPLAALVIGASFGLVRGLAVFLTRSITTTPALLAFHRRLVAAAPKARLMVIAVQIGVAALVAAAIWSPAAVLVVAILGAIALATKVPASSDGPVAVGRAERR